MKLSELALIATGRIAERNLMRMLGLVEAAASGPRADTPA
jgi:hypothetical protein